MEDGHVGRQMLKGRKEFLWESAGETLDRREGLKFDISLRKRCERRKFADALAACEKGDFDR